MPVTGMKPARAACPCLARATLAVKAQNGQAARGARATAGGIVFGVARVVT